VVHPRYGVAPWLDAVPPTRRPEFPLFRGDVTSPVVIIGAGMTGCMTAYACAAAGLKVIVVDAGRIGQGGTARAPGFLSSEACGSYRALEARVGRRAARLIFDAARLAPRELAATVKRLGLKVPFVLTDAVRLVAAWSHDTRLGREAGARTDVGLDAAWLKPAAVARRTFVNSSGGVRLRDWGFADPYRLATSFAQAAVARGAQIFERSRVRRIAFDRRRAKVVLERGAIVTEAAVICTGEPTELLGALRRHFRFTERYTVMTEPLGAAARAELGPRTSVVCDTDVPPHHVWFTADHRAVVSGGDRRRQPLRLREKSLVQRTGQLMYELSRLYPSVSGATPVNAWDTPLACSIDGVLYAGKHRNFPHQHMALGTLHDPARAFLASRILLRSVLGEPSKADEPFLFARNL
jgi:glycine/D-amino acid oxidase-like deaminating enzyme